MPRRQRDQAVGLLERARQRLLDQHRHAARQERPAPARRAASVGAATTTASTGGSAEASAKASVPCAAAIVGGARRVGIGDADQRHAGQRREDAGVVLAQMPDADDGRRAAARRSRRRLPARRGGVRAAGRRWRCPRRRRPRRSPPARRSAASCRRRPTSAVAPAARIAAMVGTPTTGTSKRMSCFGLATLTTTAPAPASWPARAMVGVGALHRLDGDDGAILHDDGLADVEAGDRVGLRVAERQVGFFARVRRARASATPAGASSGDRNAVESSRPMPFSCITSATAAMSESVFFEVSLRMHREQRQVGHEVGEDLHVLDLAGHHRLGDRRRLEHRDHLAQLAERDPVQRRAARLGGGDEGRLGFVLDGDDGDRRGPARARPRGRGTGTGRCRRSARAGSPARCYSSATTASSARRVSVRRSTTPREEVRMKSTR